MVAADLEAVGIPTELRAAAARGVQAVRRVGRAGALQLRLDRRLPTRPTPTWHRCSVVGQRQPHRLPVAPRGRLPRARPGPAPTPPSRSVGASRAARPRGRRSSCRSPSSAPRWSSRDRVEGLAARRRRHRRLDPRQPRRLSRIGWPLPEGPCTVTTPQGDPGATSEWRNWQTRQLEGLVSARTWGFKSPLRHDLGPRRRAAR